MIVYAGHNDLPKRVPGAALDRIPGVRSKSVAGMRSTGVSGMRNTDSIEQPPLAWRPYPPTRPVRPERTTGSAGLAARLVAAAKARLRRH
jgi:hypothetical protein